MGGSPELSQSGCYCDRFRSHGPTSDVGLFSRTHKLTELGRQPLATLAPPAKE
jgi:hypothetical protein